MASIHKSSSPGTSLSEPRYFYGPHTQIFRSRDRPLGTSLLLWPPYTNLPQIKSVRLHVFDCFPQLFPSVVSQFCFPVSMQSSTIRESTSNGQKPPTACRPITQLLLGSQFGIILPCRRTYQCSFASPFACIRISARTQTHGHTKTCLYTQTRMHVFLCGTAAYRYGWKKQTSVNRVYTETRAKRRTQTWTHWHTVVKLFDQENVINCSESMKAYCICDDTDFRKVWRTVVL